LKPPNGIPLKIDIDIELPRINTIEEINVQISPKRLLLRAINSYIQYYLDISLPYDVETEKDKAEFNQDLHLLNISLHVQQVQIKPKEEIQILHSKEKIKEKINTEIIDQEELRAYDLDLPFYEFKQMEFSSSLGTINPAYTVKQTLSTLSIVVHVTNVILPVNLRYSKTHDYITITFIDNTKQSYELPLHLFNEIEEDSIIDVSKKNIIIILKKKKTRYWATVNNEYTL